MVAAERMARTQAENRLKDTEENLAAAESAMRDMQLHLQSLAAPAHPSDAASIPMPRRYLSSHLPFSEFLSFIAHLRSLRPLKETSKAMFPPPAISTLLAQPFIARAITEDHEPTIRLDAAPDLSYFSRRNVGPAIIAGELFIEPVSANTVLSATTAPPHDINCSLCGKPVFPHIVPQSPAVSSFGAPPLHPAQKQSRFSLKPFFNTASSPSGNAHSPGHSPLASPSLSAAASSLSLPPVYVFRVNRPANSSTGTNEKDAKVYPLCRTGWCLERLRAACDLWHFVRTGIIHVVWHGDDGHLLLAEQAHEHGDATPTQADRRVSSSSIAMSESGSNPTPPALPERKKSGGWGLGFKLGSNEKPSGSPGGWFGRSTSATPPRSPGTPGTPNPADEATESAKPTGLDPPIELQSPAVEKGDGDNEGAVAPTDVPVINRVEASPEVEARDAAREGDDATATTESGSKEPDLEEGIPRNGSQRSLASSGAATDEAAFATPKGAPDGLPEDVAEEGNTGEKADGGEGDVGLKDGEGQEKQDEEKQEEEKQEEEKQDGEKQEEEKGEKQDGAQEEHKDEMRQEEEAKVDQESAEGQDKDEVKGVEDKDTGVKEEATTEEAATETAPSEAVTAPVDPIVDLTESAPASPALSGPPPIPRRAANRMSAKPPARDLTLAQGDTPATPSEEGIAETKETAEEASKSTAAETAEATLKSPPPLPPRHPRTPRAPGQPRDSVVEGEKRWMKEDSEAWEEKTWRMVVKFKEGMWKARIGVTDDAEA